MHSVVQGLLYMGGWPAVENLDALQAERISRVITVANMDPPSFSEDAMVAKSFWLEDSEDSDLLSILDEAIAYIEEARKGEERVLVHCVNGVSRSAAVCTAYLMKCNKLSFEKAFKFVKMANQDACPNDGFIRQLDQFYNNGCTGAPVTAQQRAEKAQMERDETGNVVESSMAADATSAGSKETYHCRKCRRLLFSEKNILDHEQGAGQQAFSRRKRDATVGGITCGSFFIEPMRWMKDKVSEFEGQLYCVKCNAKLGGYKWQGTQCSCGQWVTPAFQIPKNNVDRKVNVNLAASTPSRPRIPTPAQ